MKSEKMPRLTGSTLIPLFILAILTLSGCDIIDGIFKTGIGIGAFIVIVVVIIIIVISRRFRR